ncbi:hypothetical protein [Nannocystis radixulma]|uniref:Uncharacterized protein n=1 Tax=Nannocystis radixulma TaxID=2995305 RepID=A0ABT5AZV1_9BACT|nr:hypothetical protein [Nannocystis radixulma]MDC0667363.1 hypothetical protein [Nannocystis radixulma]
MHHGFFKPLREFCSAGTYLGLVLAGLTHASGCAPECEHISRDFTLTVEPVDEDGVHLNREALAAAFDTAKIEICVDGYESYCVTSTQIQLDLEKRVFELWHTELAYNERRHCELASVRFSVEIPGCEPGEFVLPSEEATDATELQYHAGLLKIICRGA